MSDLSKTDWKRLDAMTDCEIDTSDIPPLDEEFFRRARCVNISTGGEAASRDIAALIAQLKRR